VDTHVDRIIASLPTLSYPLHSSFSRYLPIYLLGPCKLAGPLDALVLTDEKKKEHLASAIRRWRQQARARDSSSNSVTLARRPRGFALRGAGDYVTGEAKTAFRAGVVAHSHRELV
jgi:hypothetical protein